MWTIIAVHLDNKQIHSDVTSEGKFVWTGTRDRNYDSSKVS